MNKKRKALILLGIAITAIAVSVVVFGQWWKLLTPETEDLMVAWACENETKTVIIAVLNNGNKAVNVTRVELIYLPDETLGLIWIELHTIEPSVGDSFEWKILEGGIEEEFQLEFFNLLLEGENKELVRIEVETPKAIYTFVPQSFGVEVKPTSIEKK